MLSYNEITQRKYIDLDGTPYEVISSHVSRKQAQKPINQTKLRNLISGKVTEKAFHSSDTVNEAVIETEKYTYLFKKASRQSGGMEYWFAKGGDRKNRIEIPGSVIEQEIQYVKENTDVDALVFNEKIIGI
jgi:elongation factor P